MIHGFRELLQRALEGEVLPMLTTIERQSAGAGSEWGQAESRVGALLVSSPDDQMASPHTDAETL